VVWFEAVKRALRDRTAQAPPAAPRPAAA
jgi:hypothetical protein